MPRITSLHHRVVEIYETVKSEKKSHVLYVSHVSMLPGSMRILCLTLVGVFVSRQIENRSIRCLYFWFYFYNESFQYQLIVIL